MIGYLITFFESLGKLSDVPQSDVPQAIDFENGSLYVLISMGDLRARLPLTRMDPDPVQAAADVFDQWQAMQISGPKPLLEGRRG